MSTWNGIATRTYENGLMGWSANESAETLSQSSEDPARGSYELKVETEGSAQFQGARAFGTFEVPTTGGKQWTLSVWVRSPDEEGLSVTIQSRDSNGSFLENHTGNLGFVSTTNTRYSFTFTAHADAVSLHDVGIFASAQVTSTFYVDGWQLDEGASALPYDGDDYSSLPILNRGYEANADEWEAGNGAEIGFITTAPKWGVGELGVIFPGQTSFELVQSAATNWAEVSASTEYTISVYIRQVTGDPANLTFRVTSQDGSGTSLENHTSSGFTLTGSYVRYSYTFTTNASAERLGNFQINDGGTAQDVGFAIDGWQLDIGDTTREYDGPDAPSLPVSIRTIDIEDGGGTLQVSAFNIGPNEQLFCVVDGDTGDVVTAPSGWTEVEQGSTGTWNMCKIFQQDSPSNGTYDFTIPSDSDGSAVLFAVDADTTVTLDDSGVNTSEVAPSVTAAKDDSLLICYFLRQGDTGLSDGSTPSGMSVWLDNHKSDNWGNRLGTYEIVSSGATGTRTSTSGDNPVSFSLVFSEAADAEGSGSITGVGSLSAEGETEAEGAGSITGTGTLEGEGNSSFLGATTLPATQITKDSATLNGEVNPGGEDTSYHFEYGLASTDWPSLGWENRENLIPAPLPDGIGEWLNDGFDDFEAVTLDGSAHPEPLTLPSGEVIDKAFRCRLDDADEAASAILNDLVEMDAGVEYQFGMWVFVAEGSIRVRLRDSDNVALFLEVASVAVGEWEWWESPVGEAQNSGGGDLHITDQSTSGAVEFYFALPRVEEGSLSGIDFPTPDLLDSGEAEWTGTAHASTSTLAPLSIPAGEDGDAGNGISDVSVNEQVTDLKPDTEYSYRLVAENVNGIEEGDTKSFITLPVVPDLFVELADTRTIPTRAGISNRVKVVKSHKKVKSTP